MRCRDETTFKAGFVIFNPNLDRGRVLTCVCFYLVVCNNGFNQLGRYFIGRFTGGGFVIEYQVLSRITADGTIAHVAVVAVAGRLAREITRGVFVAAVCFAGASVLDKLKRGVALCLDASGITIAGSPAVAEQVNTNHGPKEDAPLGHKSIWSFGAANRPEDHASHVVECIELAVIVSSQDLSRIKK
jgi:hypothetical protein